MEDIINKKKEGSPVGEPSDNTKDTITDSTEDNTKDTIEDDTKGNAESNTEDSANDDEITKKIKEILSSELASFKGDFQSTITELKDSSEALKQEKYKIEIEKLLAESEVLDGRFYDFIYSDDIELVKVKIENLENLISEKIEEVVQKIVDERLGASSWTPASNSNTPGIDTYKKPSYML